MRLPPVRVLLTAACALGAAAAPSAVAVPGHGDAAPVVHRAGWVRDPHRALGTHDPHSPIDHVVVVMQENHSFDEYFGMLPREGQPKADGFSFDEAGRPVNSDRDARGRRVVVSHHPQLCSGDNAGQSWDSSHLEIDGGRMDGFAALNPGAMHYYTRRDLPFYYSLASRYTLANRWFSSVPAQTYPNRRFLYAATAYGLTGDPLPSYDDAPPPHGTIMDEFAKYGVSWHDYVTDLPDTALITSNIKRYPYRYTDIAQFYLDAKAGTLPDVSYVESDGGVTGEVGKRAEKYTFGRGLPEPTAVRDSFIRFDNANGDEEDADVRIGERFVARVVRAVTRSPDWKHTLLIWLYDEHGGFYDHVPPPAAPRPDGIMPSLSKDDVPGGYNLYGVRVPAVVVSPFSRPHAVTNVVHDHTSILAEIEELWNLPALTARDANAHDLGDFLDLHQPRMMTPPHLAAPGPVDLLSCRAEN